MLDKADGRPRARQLRRKAQIILEEVGAAEKRRVEQLDSQTDGTSRRREGHPSEPPPPRKLPSRLPPQLESLSNHPNPPSRARTLALGDLQTRTGSHHSRLDNDPEASSGPVDDRPGAPLGIIHPSQFLNERGALAARGRRTSEPPDQDHRDRAATQDLRDNTTSSGSRATPEHQSHYSQARVSSRSSSDSGPGPQAVQETSPKAQTPNHDSGANQAVSPGPRDLPSIDFAALWTSILEKKQSKRPSDLPKIQALEDLGLRDHVRYLATFARHNANRLTGFSCR